MFRYYCILIYIYFFISYCNFSILVCTFESCQKHAIFVTHAKISQTHITHATLAKIGTMSPTNTHTHSTHATHVPTLPIPSRLLSRLHLELRASVTLIYYVTVIESIELHGLLRSTTQLF